MRYCYLVGLLTLTGCMPDKLTCYQDNLEALKLSPEYREVMVTGKKQLPRLTGERGQNLFRDTTYVDTAIIDDAVFFNKDKNKCVLLILQKTSKELYLDQVLIIQGTKLKGEWKFKQNRMPGFELQAAEQKLFICFGNPYLWRNYNIN